VSTGKNIVVGVQISYLIRGDGLGLNTLQDAPQSHLMMIITKGEA